MDTPIEYTWKQHWIDIPYCEGIENVLFTMLYPFPIGDDDEEGEEDDG